MNAVEISGLTKKYGKFNALNGIDLVVPQGTIYGLLGPNGAGKTTLIKALVGALKPTSGSAKVAGLDPLKDKWQIRKLIGYMPQSSALYEDLTARDNLSFFGKAKQLPNLAQKVNEILVFTELENRADEPVRNFSGGMKKRVSLACALLHEPKILFLDEPTAAVDPHLKLRSWELFRKLTQKGVTLFISTHLMDEALLCDKVTILRNGEIITVDTPWKIMEKGKSFVKVVLNGETKEFTIGSDEQSLPAFLKQYGLNNEITSLCIRQESLENIVLDMIRQRENKVPISMF